MLKYKIDILEELKTKGYTTYKLRKDKVIGEAQIQKIMLLFTPFSVTK